ncbi:helix-turn-helix domain-containing protein (plasmid) [Rhodococcus pyridinivorans]|uniref:Helix-turn-helix domain-containing protein n=2 Tax=unclassified Rhodococcus (in: high G+C Gram-positive bacteria) TaxID=192944 RepID=A0AAU7UUI1_9NOCA|nr:MULTISPECIES: helix-turn-helix domain-containing protein [Rhodococcus]APE12768.1 transcriptional regulator [Rhodococcus sp. 2G]MCT7294236.1 helix-turn-helix domain-containing protein [Rhodococcus sp. PAE-6]QXU56508.1 DDE-type integrase/transposase/recombinase [Rhodococcus sp. LW-XY12]UPK62167.1 helix-turn-helix domain-containing protein [Rhodococcus pyridinivorans]UPK63597.1 helix-turn-helix domain-containing protein [Rhodococcus pyridinivorans]
MLTWEEDVEIHALHKRGWTISAIARHTGRNRRTIRNYLNGTTTPGIRKPAGEDPFEPFVDYVTARLTEDPHLWARTLCDELEDLGYTASYQTLTRQIRQRKLRPVCQACACATDRPNAVIDHPAGAETQWDWVELPNPPASWGWGKTAYLLVGSLAHSGRWRGVLAPAMTQPHLIDGLDRICRKLGGLTHTWRFDRMSTVCYPDSGKVTASFAGVAKYYGVLVAICPPRSGNRKGVVEKSNHTAAQRWWRTVADELTVEQAQASVDKFCSRRADARMRATADGKAPVRTVADREPLTSMPSSPYPVVLSEPRTVSRQALVAYRGNRYSVPPELAAAQVTVTRQLGDEVIDIVTASQITVARHRLAPDGAGAVVRDHGHVHALEQAAMAGAAAGGRPHRRKERIPPGPEALTAAAALRTNTTDRHPPSTTPRSTVVDLAAYERAARGRNTLV